MGKVVSLNLIRGVISLAPFFYINNTKHMKLPTITVSLTILIVIILFIFTKKKSYDYEQINSIEYNKGYNEIHPIIDTIIPYYKNAQPIFVRSGFNIGGHTGIGSINGGSLVLFICNNDCLKCIEN